VSRQRKKAAATDEAPAPKYATELDAVFADIGKHMGEEMVMDASKLPPCNHIPTGSFMLDLATLGGMPEGFPAMFYGYESSGKTTIIKKIVGEFQKKYPQKKAVWVDTEGMFDAAWAKQLGVDTSSLKLARPENGQQAVDIIDAVVGAWETGLVVLDSVPSCVSKAILDKSADDDTMTELARLMGKLCSKLAMSFNRERKRGHHVTFLYTNQWRGKPGVMFGDPRTLPGGRQINHICTTKLEVKNAEEMGKDKHDIEVVEFNQHSFKITKAKHGASVRSGEFRMMINPDNDKGLPQGSYSDADTMVVYGKKMGLITGGGSSWKIDDNDTKFAKLVDIETYLRENAAAYLSLKQAIVAMQRVDKGLPALPPDGYLFDWCAIA
jgi:recombination protein RecA